MAFHAEEGRLCDVRGARRLWAVSDGLNPLITTCRENIYRTYCGIMSRQPQPGTIPATAQNVLKNEAILWLMCGNCDREKKADLAGIVARGLGDVPIASLKFRCSACGSTAVHPHLSSASADRFRKP
jgi:hypothetical protein